MLTATPPQVVDNQHRSSKHATFLPLIMLLVLSGHMTAARFVEYPASAALQAGRPVPLLLYCRTLSGAVTDDLGGDRQPRHLQHMQPQVSSYPACIAKGPCSYGSDPPALLAAAPREVPLDTYRNIGIMAHIDAGKVGQGALLQTFCFADTCFDAASASCWLVIFTLASYVNLSSSAYSCADNMYRACPVLHG